MGPFAVRRMRIKSCPDPRLHLKSRGPALPTRLALMDGLLSLFPEGIPHPSGFPESLLGSEGVERFDPSGCDGESLGSLPRG